MHCTEIISLSKQITQTNPTGQESQLERGRQDKLTMYKGLAQEKNHRLHSSNSADQSKT